MSVLFAIIDASVRHRGWVVLLTVILAALAGREVVNLRLDAFPDLTNTQVQVLTSAPGLGAEEAELLVTVPVERVMGGLPGLTALRSLSRPGISAVTAVFADGTDPWLARQLVRERLSSAEVPEGVARPELGPPTTGLGEVWQFTLWSDRHTRPELYRIFERDVAPRLRTAPGVVEVNAWGAGSPRLDVAVDPWRLAARGLDVTDVHRALADQLGTVSGGNRDDRGDERLGVRAAANPTTPVELEALALGMADGVPLRLGDVARVSEGGALTVGLGTSDGKGEALFGVVQLLAGADARAAAAAARDLAEELGATLPEGVRLEPIYDREKLVGATLGTVERSLLEGGALVILVLLLTLGDLRAGLIVASVIPLALLGALAGLSLLGFSGNLMSLGAVDFGLVVDGAVVVVEGIVALQVVGGVGRDSAIAARAKAVATPVLASVGILLVVYLPILTLQGTEGKLFRPMAVTVLLALAAALALSFTYVPALCAMWVNPRGHHETLLMRALSVPYQRVANFAMARPRLAAGGALLTVLLAGLAATRLGVLFVPRLEEGDLVVQTERSPAIGPDAALREATRVERALLRFPEVLRVGTRVGSPALATDPMGLHEGDTLVTLAPRHTWTTASTLDGLNDALAAAIHAEAPGADLTFTQPIEMRFNELLEGIPSDVGISVFGPDLDVLLTLGRQIADRLAQLEGAADVRAPATEGMPVQTATIDFDRAARLGVPAERALATVQAAQVGREVGRVQRGAWRDPVVVRWDLASDVGIGDLPLITPDGRTVPLDAVADVRVDDLPALVRREDGSRRVVVQANVRGRDLGAFVAEAQGAVSEIQLPPGYRVTWSGKLEQLRDASVRTAVTIPVVLLLVIALLRATFGAFRPVWLISLNVPLAVSGGVFALYLLDLPISMSAIVGFIALFGIAVMNGIVLVSRIQERMAFQDVYQAVGASARERFRPVLMTATVAGLGFVPMALATGVGAEVQRPLATVVLGGLVTSTVLTLVVLPALAPWFLRAQNSKITDPHQERSPS